MAISLILMDAEHAHEIHPIRHMRHYVLNGRYHFIVKWDCRQEGVEFQYITYYTFLVSLAFTYKASSTVVIDRLSFTIPHFL